MAESGLTLVTGAGGGVGGVGGKVVSLLRQCGRDVRAMVHHDDERADALRAAGADVVVGDLTRPEDVATALDSVQRMMFSMSVAPSYLEAAVTVATVARAVGELDAVVAISQLTVSQMDAVSLHESHHQRLHWLSEQVLNWSGLPVVHVRPTLFLDSPILTTLAALSIADATSSPRRSAWDSPPPAPFSACARRSRIVFEETRAFSPSSQTTVLSTASRPDSAAQVSSAITASPVGIGATSRTPGIADAAAASKERSVPPATGHRITLAKRIPGRRTSPEYTASPLTMRGPSTRRRSRPTRRNCDEPLSGGSSGTARAEAASTSSP